MEYLDIVDRDDNIIGSASKHDANDNRLGHRIIHVFLFADDGRIALQLRGKDLYWCPDHWSTAVGGYVSKGQTYEEAAMREFQEELGTTSPLTFLAKDIYDVPGGGFKHLHIYTTTYNGPFNPSPHEVQRVEYFSIDQIRDMITNGEKFHPELLYLLHKYYLDTDAQIC